MIRIERMGSNELVRISEIDRSELIRYEYRLEKGELLEVEVDWDVGPWPWNGQSGHTVQDKIREWKPFLGGSGEMYGAFQDERLLGLMIYQPQLTERMALLAVLHVTHGYRGQGIGTSLAMKAFDLARRHGKSSIYVSSTPTKRTVDFYRHIGFKVAERTHPTLFEKEPDDIHMIKSLE